MVVGSSRHAIDAMLERDCMWCVVSATDAVMLALTQRPVTRIQMNSEFVVKETNSRHEMDLTTLGKACTIMLSRFI